MEQNVFQGIPGIPSPSTVDHSPYIKLISSAADWAEKQKGWDRLLSEPIVDLIVYISFLISETKFWIETFTYSQIKAAAISRDKNTYYRVIAQGVSTPEVERICLLLLPSLDVEKYFPQFHPAPSPEKIGPARAPKKKASPAEPRKETIVQFITEHAPSINYLQVFIYMSRHTINRRSSRGRKVYPYGQGYLVRKLDISRATVVRIFSWLRRRHIIFKRSNENRDRKKSATWFVCASWKQSVYFWDPKGRRSKRRSSGSSRRRDFPPVHAPLSARNIP